jgi:hypothetical protein
MLIFKNVLIFYVCFSYSLISEWSGPLIFSKFISCSHLKFLISLDKITWFKYNITQDTTTFKLISLLLLLLWCECLILDLYYYPNFSVPVSNPLDVARDYPATKKLCFYYCAISNFRRILKNYSNPFMWCYFTSLPSFYYWFIILTSHVKIRAPILPHVPLFSTNHLFYYRVKIEDFRKKWHK